MDNKEEKKVIGQIIHPHTKFELSLQEFKAVQSALSFFSSFNRVAEMLQQTEIKAVNQGALVEYFEEDIEVNEKGEKQFDERGNPILKQEFWDRVMKPKEQPKIEIIKK